MILLALVPFGLSKSTLKSQKGKSVAFVEAWTKINYLNGQNSTKNYAWLSITFGLNPDGKRDVDVMSSTGILASRSLTLNFFLLLDSS